MSEKETEFRIVIKARNPHMVIDRLHEFFRIIQHDVLDKKRGSITIEARTYRVKDEEEETRT